MSKVFVFILLTLSLQSIAQFHQNDWLVGATYNYVKYEGFESKNAFGVNAEYRFSKRFGFELSIAAGKDYMHYGVGSILLPPVFLLLNKRNKDKGGGMLLFLLSFIGCLEQTNFHIPLGSTFEIVPYISLLKLKYIYDDDYSTADTYFSSWAAGTKVCFLTKKNWYLSMMYEVGRLNKSGSVMGQLGNSANVLGQQAGINLAYIIKAK